MYYVHKYDVQQQYGGPEEGGWWYDSGVPEPHWIPPGFMNEDDAYEFARSCNEAEHERQEQENRYGYTSVLSYTETFYSYYVEDYPDPRPFPQERPHYE